MVLNRLEPMVSTQKSALKYMHRVMRYWQKDKIFQKFCLKGYICINYCQYLRTQWIYFKARYDLGNVKARYDLGNV